MLLGLWGGHLGHLGSRGEAWEGWRGVSWGRGGPRLDRETRERTETCAASCTPDHVSNYELLILLFIIYYLFIFLVHIRSFISLSPGITRVDTASPYLALLVLSTYRYVPVLGTYGALCAKF